jgi:hypothetical protein
MRISRNLHTNITIGINHTLVKDKTNLFRKQIQKGKQMNRQTEKYKLAGEIDRKQFNVTCNYKRNYTEQTDPKTMQHNNLEYILN